MVAIIHHCRFPTTIPFSRRVYRFLSWGVSVCNRGATCMWLTWLTFAVLHVTGELKSRSTFAGDATLLRFPADVCAAVILVHAGGSLLCAFHLYWKDTERQQFTSWFFTETPQHGLDAKYRRCVKVWDCLKWTVTFDHAFVNFYWMTGSVRFNDDSALVGTCLCARATEKGG